MLSTGIAEDPAGVVEGDGDDPARALRLERGSRGGSDTAAVLVVANVDGHCVIPRIASSPPSRLGPLLKKSNDAQLSPTLLDFSPTTA
jgi:hypothetical protein